MPKRMPGYELLHLLTAAQMVERLPAQARVLVVGAGTGQEILRLARARPDWQFTAADVSPDMLALAQQNFVKAGIADRVQLHAGPLEALNSGHNHDAALLILVAHFVPHDGRKLRLLQEIAERLSPGALLLMADLMAPEDAWEWRVYKRACMELGLPEDTADAALKGFAEDFHPLNEIESESLLTASGFDLPKTYFRALGFRAFATVLRCSPAPVDTH